MDRNSYAHRSQCSDWLSLSARRAWIEIEEVENYEEQTEVALRKESVDRNTSFSPASLFDLRRSPQGERG